MSRDDHERAQRLVAESRIGSLAAAEQKWLDTHLAGCEACSRYGEQLANVVRALRSVSVMPSAGLVKVTQLRVRARAQELRARQAAMRPLWIACTVAVLLSAVSTPYLWMGFQWLGRAFGVGEFVWVAAFVTSWAMPAIFGAALLIARETHMKRADELESRSRG